MSTQNFQDMDDAALVRSLVQKQQTLVRARFQKNAGKLENTASLGDMRKGLARLRTEVRRRELAAGLPKDALISAHPVDARTLPPEGGAVASGGFLSGVVDKITG